MLLSAGSSQAVFVRACLEEQFHELAALFCSIFILLEFSCRSQSYSLVTFRERFVVL